MQFNQKIFSSRLEKVREYLSQQKFDAILISSVTNRYYLTGWPGDSESGYLLITAKAALVITDSRYTEDVVENIPHFSLKEFGFANEFWKDIFAQLQIKKVGFESQDLSVFNQKKLKKQSSATFIPTVDFIEKLRSIKDSQEIELLRKSAYVCSQAFEFVLKNIRVGQSEKEIAWELEKTMRSLGAEKNAWDKLIVAAGEHSSRPHYGAGNRKIKSGDMVMLDFGCVFEGYSSDMTRVLFVDNVNGKQAEVYKQVHQAQKLGISLVKPDGSAALIDRKVRESLKNVTDFPYRHGLGHGVGLEVHEIPSVNYTSKAKLEVGNVITIEPGIYEPDWGGVRIEDMVLVTKGGYEVLTTAEKILEKVIVK